MLIWIHSSDYFWKKKSGKKQLFPINSRKKNGSTGSNGTCFAARIFKFLAWQAEGGKKHMLYLNNSNFGRDDDHIWIIDQLIIYDINISDKYDDNI